MARVLPRLSFSGEVKRVMVQQGGALCRISVCGVTVNNEGAAEGRRPRQRCRCDDGNREALQLQLKVESWDDAGRCWFLVVFNGFTGR